MSKPGWELVRLGDVVEPRHEKGIPNQFPDARFIGLEHIEAETNRLLGWGSAADVRSTKAIFKAGDVLYGKMRPYLRKVCQPDFDGLCSTDILVFPKMLNLDPGYLKHFLSQESTSDYATEHSNGINIPRIAPSVLEKIPLPLPPLAEQRRIVSRIEELWQRALRVRDVLSDAKPLVGRAERAVLAAAFRGDLTAELRSKGPLGEAGGALLDRLRAEKRSKAQDGRPREGGAEGFVDWVEEGDVGEALDVQALPALPAAWCWAAAEEVVAPGSDIAYGIVQPGEQVADGVPYVRAKDIKDGVIQVDQLLRTSPAIARSYQRSALEAGDVLLGIIRATKVAIVPESLRGGNITQGTARFRPSSIMRSTFLARWLASPYAQNWLHQRYRGIDMPGLNLRDVRRLPVPVPPIEEQRAIELVVTRALTSIRGMTHLVADVGQQCERLHQAILSRAFHGELVGQEPADEPASQLLARIAEERRIAKETAKVKKEVGAVATTKKPTAEVAARELGAWLQQHPTRTFTFDELRGSLNIEYDVLKDAIFDLLRRGDSVLRQVFNEAERRIEFRGGSQ